MFRRTRNKLACLFEVSRVKIWRKLALSFLFLLFPILVHGFECEDLFVVASLNLEDFGNGGCDCKADLLDDLARIIGAESVDLIALQEVMPANEDCYKIDQDVDNANPKLVHIAQLRRELEELSGDHWESISSGPYEYGKRNRTEYYVFLFNSSVEYRKVMGSANGLLDAPFQLYPRPPMYAFFRCNKFDFYAVNYHAPSKGSSVDPCSEVPKLAAFWDALLSNSQGEKDIILLGDLNVSDPVQLIDSGGTGRGTFRQLIEDPTTCAGSRLDVVLIAAEHTSNEYTGAACIIDETCRLGISNHKLILACFRTDKDDD